jgi:hypothetical protein
MFEAMRVYYSSIFKKLLSNKKLLQVTSLIVLYAIILFAVAFNARFIGLEVTLFIIIFLSVVFLLGIVPFISWYIVYYKDK